MFYLGLLLVSLNAALCVSVCLCLPPSLSPFNDAPTHITFYYFFPGAETGGDGAALHSAGKKSMIYMYTCGCLCCVLSACMLINRSTHFFKILNKTHTHTHKTRIHNEHIGPSGDGADAGPHGERLPGGIHQGTFDLI